MTREEKDNQMLKAVKRLNRFTTLLNYHNEKYGDLADAPTALIAWFRVVGMAVNMNSIATQKPSDMKHPSPKFPDGGITLNK